MNPQITVKDYSLKKGSPDIPLKKPDSSGILRKRLFNQNYIIVILNDIVLLNLIFFAIIAIQIPEKSTSLIPLKKLPLFFIGVNLFWVVTAFLTNIYRVYDRENMDLKIKDLLSGTVIYFGIMSMFYYQFFFVTYQVHFLLPAFFTFIAFSVLTHIAFRNYYRSNMNELNYVVVGGKPSNLKYLDQVFGSTYGDKASCLGRFGHTKIQGIKDLGSYNNIVDYVKKNHIDKLLYIYSDIPNNEVQKIIQLCRSRFIDFEVVPREIDLFKKGIQVEQLEHLPIFRRKYEPLHQFHNKLIKRAFDIIFSLLVIVFIFPWFLPIVFILIKLESPGPVFFLQKRTGYWNKPFRFLKFRSMTVNKDSDKLQAFKGDSRITKVGAFLRRTSLDELPQFFNVLIGDMSIVGPRPHMLKHTEDYSNLIETFMIRHEVKPGITGWAQVNGWRGPTETVYKMEKRVEFDVHYIENWTLLFDLRCIYLTVVNMIKGEENAL